MTRNGEDLNHWVRDVDLHLIEGTPAEALCGITFIPELRVGSGGEASEPSFGTCPECERVDDLLEEVVRLKEERNRAMRELNAAARDIFSIRAEGAGISVSEARRRVRLPSPERHETPKVPAPVEPISEPVTT